MADKSTTIDVAAALSTPEVKRAIAEEAAKAAALAVQELMKGGASVLPADAQTQHLFSQMALAIAEMNNQGSGRAKPVAPEIMAKRQAAQKALDELLGEVAHHLKKAKEAGDQKAIERWLPRYRVTGKIYFAERLVEPFTRSQRRGDPPVATVITWSGPPNHSLHPKNEIARRLVDLFREAVGSAPLLRSISGPNGGQAALDNRRYWMTVEGRVVKGNPPPSATVLDLDDDIAVSPRDAIDPFAESFHILGTVAEPAKNGSQIQPQRTAAELSQM